VLNRMHQQLTAHARLIFAAVERFQSRVDDVTRFTGRYERHLVVTFHSSWLTFPNMLLNMSLASHDSTENTLELGNLLEIDEVQDVSNWKQRFWTRSEVCTRFAFHIVCLCLMLAKQTAF